MRAVVLIVALMGLAACGTLTGSISGSFDVRDAREKTL